MGSDILDETDCGNFFDQTYDWIEFPLENESGGGSNLIGSVSVSGDSEDFPIIWNGSFPDSDPLFSGNSTLDLWAELSVPYEDIVQLEWLSTLVEDSCSDGGMAIGKENSCLNKEEASHKLFHTSGPVSISESTITSPSSGKMMPLYLSHWGPQRTRSKRTRPATFNPRAAIQLISPSSSLIETPQPFVGISSKFENFEESSPMMIEIPNLSGGEPKKRKKLRVTSPEDANVMETTINENLPTQAVRMCLHCEITKTPQWRAGPLGPKTLCNACGVRYMSGRLFPEYRPAASPTFVPSLHSNSHKKVLEMRGKVGNKNPVTAAKSELVSCASV